MLNVTEKSIKLLIMSKKKNDFSTEMLVITRIYCTLRAFGQRMLVPDFTVDVYKFFGNNFMTEQR